MSLRGGVNGWVSRLSKVCVCWMGVGGLHQSVYRKSIAAHMVKRQQAKTTVAQTLAASQVRSIRATHKRGATFLADSRSKLEALVLCTDPENTPAPPPLPISEDSTPAQTRIFVQLRRDPETCAAYHAAFAASDSAMTLLLSSVQTMLQLTHSGFIMRPDTYLAALRQWDTASAQYALDKGNAAGEAKAQVRGRGAGSVSPPVDSMGGRGPPPKPQMLMPLFEQAEIVRDWAESVLVKTRLCSCPGCSAVALQVRPQPIFSFDSGSIVSFTFSKLCLFPDFFVWLSATVCDLADFVTIEPEKSDISIEEEREAPSDFVSKSKLNIFGIL